MRDCVPAHEPFGAPPHAPYAVYVDVPQLSPTLAAHDCMFIVGFAMHTAPAAQVYVVTVCDWVPLHWPAGAEQAPNAPVIVVLQVLPSGIEQLWVLVLVAEVHMPAVEQVNVVTCCDWLPVQLPAGAPAQALNCPVCVASHVAPALNVQACEPVLFDAMQLPLLSHA